MAHTFLNISFEDPDAAATPVTIAGDEFKPNAWALVTNTNSVEEAADFGASAGDFIERAERFEAHWAGLSTFKTAYKDPIDPVELAVASFNTGINATAVEAFEREWTTNESYLFGLGPTAIAAFGQNQAVSVFANFEGFIGGWDTNESYAFNIAGITIGAALFDPVTGTEAFEDYEEEWSSNQNYAFNIGGISTSAGVFDVGGTGEPVEDYEETDLNQWLVKVVTATGSVSYTCTIEGEDMIHISAASPTVTTIRDGLIAAIAAGSKLVTTSTSGADAFLLKRDPSIQSFGRNLFLPLAVTGPQTGNLTKLETDKTANWTQTGQMAIDP